MIGSRDSDEVVMGKGDAWIQLDSGRNEVLSGLRVADRPVLYLFLPAHATLELGVLNPHKSRAARKVEGKVAGLLGNNLVIRTEDGDRVVVEIANFTRIERLDGSPGLRGDLKAGVRVEAYPVASTRLAIRIELKS